MRCNFFLWVLTSTFLVSVVLVLSTWLWIWNYLNHDAIASYFPGIVMGEHDINMTLHRPPVFTCHESFDIYARLSFLDTERVLGTFPYLVSTYIHSTRVEYTRLFVNRSMSSLAWYVRKLWQLPALLFGMHDESYWKDVLVASDVACSVGDDASAEPHPGVGADLGANPSNAGFSSGPFDGARGDAESVRHLDFSPRDPRSKRGAWIGYLSLETLGTWDDLVDFELLFISQYNRGVIYYIHYYQKTVLGGFVVLLSMCIGTGTLAVFWGLLFFVADQVGQRSSEQAGESVVDDNDDDDDDDDARRGREGCDGIPRPPSRSRAAARSDETREPRYHDAWSRERSPTELGVDGANDRARRSGSRSDPRDSGDANLHSSLDTISHDALHGELLEYPPAYSEPRGS